MKYLLLINLKKTEQFAVDLQLPKFCLRLTIYIKLLIINISKIVLHILHFWV